MFENLLNLTKNRLPEPQGEWLASRLRVVYTKLTSDSASGKSARAAILVFFVRVFSAILAFALQVFLARWMGSEQYGTFVLVWVVATMLGGLSCFGLQTAVIRFVTEYRSQKDFRHLRGILLAAPGFAIVTSIIVAILGFQMLYWFGEQITSIKVLPFYLALICLPFMALEEIQEGIARSYEMPLTAIGPAFIVRPASILGVMGFAYALGYPANAITALFSAIIATFIATILQSLILWRRIIRLNTAEFGRLKSPNADVEKRKNYTFQFRYWISISLPIFLAGGFYGLLLNADVILIGIFMNPESVAIYFAALKSLALVHFVHFAMRAASTHHFSQFYAEEDINGLSDYANKIARWTFWPTLLFAVIMVLAGKYILMMFGTVFIDGQNLLLVLALGIVVRASIGPMDSLLAMAGQQKMVMWVLATTLLCNIILNVSLIPLFGIFGAAIATSSAMIIETAAMYVAASRKLGIGVFVFSQGRKSVVEGFVS